MPKRIANDKRSRTDSPTVFFQRIRPLGAKFIVLLSLVSSIEGSLISCSRSNLPGDDNPGAASTQNTTAPSHASKSTVQGATQQEVLDPGPIKKGSMREHPAEFAWLWQKDGAPSKISLGQAEARGLTIVDLGNNWVPYIFRQKTAGVEDFQENAYAKRYVDLANDRSDHDGSPLSEHEHNFLELYGIPPSLAVVNQEWDEVDARIQSCLDEANYDPEVFRNFSGSIAFEKRKGPKRLSGLKRAKAQLKKALKKAKIPADDIDAAATHPKTSKIYAKWRRLADEVAVISHAQKRFRCERLFSTRQGKGHFKEGNFDSHVHMALAAFEKKHNLRGWGHFTTTNIATLGQSAVDSIHARLLRVIEERVVSSTGVVEDGSASAWKSEFRYTNPDGQEFELRNLAKEMTDMTIKTLGLETSESARATLHKLAELSEGTFDQLLIAIKMPKLPPYYVDNMPLDVIVDRGDVWYDLPFDEFGEPVHQGRRRFPHLTLYTTYNEQRIPLVHWRTTIGSWRSEEHEGKEYLVYKNSDVGPRVWKDIVAAPVWMPPAVTPVRSLVKYKIVKGRRVRTVNYDETGPSYTSAYGLVAAYHIRQVFDKEGNLLRELDNQIRTHGSVDYMSILRRFSHGCHRLYNMNAVRLFSFVLRNQDFIRHGQIGAGFRRTFEYEEETYTMALNTRGYRYELVKPIKVVVTEGRVRGKKKRPFTELVLKPGVDYTDPEDEFMDTDGIMDETGSEESGGDPPLFPAFPPMPQSPPPQTIPPPQP